MKLSQEQLNEIRFLVENGSVTIPTLQDDLVDHLCCVVEIGLKGGKDFNTCLHEAVSDIAPNGLEEIQKETLFLLNHNKIKNMKQITYFLGFLGAFGITTGITFRVLHLPGGEELLLGGSIIFLVLFIPLLAIDRFKVEMSKALSQRLRIITGVISGVTLGLALILKVLHLSGANLMLVMGTFVFAAGFLPFYFFTMYKKSIS